jgi:drug/metabolite transporter (DMT)-like permease
LPYGEQRVASSIAGLLNATTPLWTALIAMAVRLERDVTPTRVAGLAVGFAAPS